MLRYESSCTVLVANEYTLLNRLRKPETRCPASGSFVAEHHLERAGGFTTENPEVTERLSPLLFSFLFSVLQGRKNLKLFPDNVTDLSQRIVSQ